MSSVRNDDANTVLVLALKRSMNEESAEERVNYIIMLANTAMKELGFPKGRRALRYLEGHARDINDWIKNKNPKTIGLIASKGLAVGQTDNTTSPPRKTPMFRSGDESVYRFKWQSGEQVITQLALLTITATITDIINHEYPIK